MTTTELEELAELIHRKWPSDWRLLGRYYEIGKDDYNNVYMLVWGLDKLEELGFHPYIQKNFSDGYTLHLTVHELIVGTTRAEAVAKALLVALKEKR